MNDKYLTRSNTDCFKGICAIMVVLCHVCSRTGIGASIGLGPIYSAFGYWGVSGFMFMSGYGLICSLSNSSNGGRDYLSTFIRNRVIPIYCLMVILVVIYYVLKLLLSPESPTAMELIPSFFFGKTVISFGWYLQSIVLIYLLFYVAANLVIKYCRKPLGMPICLSVGIGLLIYVALCLVMGLGSTWYETSFSFLAGVAVACYREPIDKWLSSKRRTILTFLICIMVFLSCFMLGSGQYLHGAIKIIFKMLSSVFFCFTWLAFMRLVSLENPVTAFLGNLYLEIYIIQGAIYLLLRNKYWSLEPEWLFFVIAITLVIVVGKLIKPLTTLFMKTVKNKTT